MQQIGSKTVAKTMEFTGVAKFAWYTCPLCKEAISQRPMSLGAHLRQRHVRTKEMPPKRAGYIEMLIRNTKGCNRVIENLDAETRDYVLGFVKALRDSNPGFRPVDNMLVNCKGVVPRY